MITTKNVMEGWRLGVKKIQEKGDVFLDDEQKECHELNNFILKVEDVSDAQKAIHWIRSQSDWFYPTNEELNEAMLTANHQRTNRYVYGERIFAFNKQINQVDDYIIPLLQKKPHTRRALIVLPNPMVDDMISKRDFVSVISLWFRIVDGKLCVTSLVRSSDYLLGWPANIYQTALIQKHIAQKLGIGIGSITTNSLSAHYFTEDEWLLEKLEK